MPASVRQWFSFIFMCLTYLSIGQAWAKANYNALLLHSYHHGYVWTDDITSGITSVFDKSANKIQLYIEYMDAKRNLKPAYLQELVALYQIKFESIPFDVIIASDDNAFVFLKKYRDRLFPGVPVVFCGVNDFQDEDLAGVKNFTGVNEQADLAGGLELALKLHPDTQQIVIISVTPPTDPKIHNRLKRILPRFKDRVQFSLLDNVSMASLTETVAHLPPHSLVFYTIFFHDRIGHFFAFDESISLIAAKCKRPIYGVWDFNLGHGIIGGLLTSGFFQGESAAKLSLRILNGEKADNIPVVKKSPNKYMFDYRQLSRYGVDPASLPPNSIIINQPVSCFSAYKNIIIVISSFSLVLLSIVVWLTINILKRREVEQKLKTMQAELEHNFQKRTCELEQANAQLQSELAEKKRVEKNLVESDKRYRSLYESSHDGYAMANLDGFIIASNSTFRKMTGYSDQELLKLTFKEITPPKWQAMEEAIVRDEIFIKGYSNLYEKEFICNHGGIIPVEIRAHLFSDNEGQPKGMWAFVRDISDRKRNELFLAKAYAELENRVAERTQELLSSNEALRLAKEEADASTQAKSNFLANMSHEIRTPMNGVIAAADLALAEELTPKAEHYLNIIHSSAYSLLSIINDILDFSKIEAGKLDLELGPFYLDDVLMQITDLFMSKAIDKRIELLVDIDPQVPMALIGDALRLQQVLTNLVGNALKFTDEGGIVYIGIQLSDLDAAIKDSVSLTIYVKDNGLGIAAENQVHLFDAFSQADTSTTRKFGGTGLGLCICQRLIAMMGGRIWVESDLGQGATFYFQVDFKRQPFDKDRKLMIPKDIEGLNVLIVDDSQANRELMRKVTQNFGFNALLAASGPEAISLIRHSLQKNQPVDLIIMDWMMPGMDGIEASDKILNDLHTDIPIIMFTSVGKETEKQKAEKLGIQAFLYKPINPKTLLDVILEIFGKKPRTKYASSKSTKKISTKGSIYKKRLKGLRILVAEDNFTNQEIAKAVLEGAGIQVEIAINGKQAIDMLKMNHFDAILMDMQMPEMDGYEATQAIRRLPAYKTLPIIAMTAHAMKGDDEKCLKAGMNGYITKPISQDILFHTLWKIIVADQDTAVASEASPKADATAIAQESQSISLPPILSGIRIQDALDALDINPQVFKRILLGFLKNNQTIAETLRAAHSHKQWRQLKELAHSLKGSSANIGAYGLQKAALLLEQGSRECEETGDMLPTALINNTITELEQVLDSISKLAVIKQAPVKKEVMNTPSSPLISTTLKEFEKAIIQANPSDIQKQLSFLKEQADFPEMAALEDQISTYDYDEALNTLRTIIVRLDLME